MKKLLLIAVFLTLSFNVFSQQKINTNDLIGYWQPDKESTHLFFWKDVNGRLQIQEISDATREPLNIITLKVYKNFIFVKEIFLQNNWITDNIYTVINKKTLKCVVIGTIKDTIIYTKTK